MSRKLRGNLMLLLTAFIWGTAFVAQKSGMDYVEPFTFNGIRTLVGALVLTPVIYFLDRNNKKDAIGKGLPADRTEAGTVRGNETDAVNRGAAAEENKKSESKWLALGGVCCGTVLFIASSLQQVAMQYTDAGKAGFITALYVVLVPVMGVFIKKKVRAIVWLCVAASAGGLFLLCVPAGESFADIGFGELLLFISSLWLAVHILVIDFFVTKVDGVKLSRMQFLVCGLLSFIPMFIFETPQIENILACWLPILYTGVFSIGIAYTLQVVAQKNTDPTSASLILSLESVFSVVSGVILLHEVMTGRELLGCAIMFAAIIVSQLPERKEKEFEKDISTKQAG